MPDRRYLLTVLLACLTVSAAFVWVGQRFAAGVETAARVEIDREVALLENLDRFAPGVGAVDLVMRRMSAGAGLYAVRTPEGRTVVGNLDEPLRTEAGSDGFLRLRVRAPDGEHEVLAREARVDDTLVILIGRDLSAGRRYAEELGLVFGASFLMLALALGVLAAHGAAADRRRIGGIAEVLDSLSRGEVGRRVPPTADRDAIGRISKQLNSCLDSIDRYVSIRDWLEGLLKHELRARLTDVILALPRDFHTSPTLVRIHERVEDALRAFDGIMDLSRYRTGAAVSGRRFRLDQLAGQVVDSWRPDADERSLSLKAYLEAADIVGQPDLIALAVHNVVSNAVKYTPAGGQIRVEIVAGDGEEGAATLTVQDTGPGIAGFPNGFRDATSIRPFRRGPASVGTDGLGLGLSLVREVLELHGAQLEIAPAAQQRGTLVRMTFPGGVENGAIEHGPAASVDMAAGRRSATPEPAVE